MHEKNDQKNNPLTGMLFALIAFFLLAVMNMIAKILSETHHVIEIAFYRNLIAALPFLFMIFILKKKEFIKIKKRPIGVFSRAILGAISLTVTFAAFAVMPMADTTAFLFTASLFAPVLGIIFLAEKVGIYRWSAIIIGFIGVLIMLNPNGVVNMYGVVIAMAAAVMHASLQTVLRHIGQTESPETIVFYFVTIGTAICALGMPWVAHMPTWQDIPLFIGVGLTGLLAQYFLSLAFSKAPISVVTVFNYSGIIWATLFGWLIWQDWPAFTIWLGGGIVIASNIFMVWRENKIGQAVITSVDTKT